MNFYEQNYKQYIESTFNCNMQEQYDFFLKHMPKEGKILDIGFGSGRDMIYFNNLGYEIEGIDCTQAFVEHMKSKGYKIFNQKVEELNTINIYDGIWASASLLHVSRSNLNDVFKRCSNALKENGILYCSFKKGDYEGIIDSRFFNYINEELLKEYIKDTNLEIIEDIITRDSLSNRDIQWLNVILRKVM